MVSLRASRAEKFRRLSKEGSWIVIGQLTAVFGSLVGVRILTGLMSPEAYGELALGMTVAALVNQIILGPLSNGVTRYYAPAVEQSDIGGYLYAVRRLVVLATAVIILLVFLLSAGLLTAGYITYIGITIAALVFAALSGYNAILSGIQNAARQRSTVALHQGLESWARFLGAAGLIVWLGASSAAAMAGYAIAAMLVFVSQSFFLRKIISTGAHASRQAANWQEKIFAFSWPISVFGMFTWLQLVSDRWALKLFTTTHEVGLYAVLFQLGYYPMAMASGMVMQLLVPIFYQRAGDASDQTRNANVLSLSTRITWLTLGLTGTVFLAALLLHEQVFRLIVASEYVSVSPLLPWILLSGGIFAAGQTIALYLQSQMKTRLMMTAKIATALMGLLFNFVGAYWYGTAGIAAASVLFSISYFLWMVALSNSGVGNILGEH
ncbi:MAG: hypothetical protein FD168_1182 [Desulfobulbaceae bacterium]|nr:MAG: hypothetical protein FD168_1182 [Desulfobulbaceae bacterium]